MKRLLLLLIAWTLLIMIPAGAVVFNTATSSEGCIAWSYTPNAGATGDFTELVLDGYVVRNLSMPDNPDHGFIILCGFEPDTCHRLDASNETDNGAYATNTTCTTGYSWDSKYLSLFLFAAWIIFLILAEWRMDVIYGLINFALAILSYRNEIFMSYTFSGISLDIIMFLVSAYIVIMVFWEYLKRRGEAIRIAKAAKEAEDEY